MNLQKSYSEVSDRVIVVDDVNNDTIEDGLNKIMNAPTQNEESLKVHLLCRYSLD